jgi:glycosyltransferase involved in cell wall biosynthesis
MRHGPGNYADAARPETYNPPLTGSRRFRRSVALSEGPVDSDNSQSAQTNPMQFNGVYVLWEEPLVLSCLGHHDRTRFLELRPTAIMLCFPSWLQTWRDLPRMFRDYVVGRRRRKFLHFMSCSHDEERVLRPLGLPGALVSQNAYVNEHTFIPTGAPKEFDAVYTAQMLPFKRMHLAAQIPALFVVTYGDVLTPSGEYDLHHFCPAIAHADHNRRWIGFDEVNRAYNSARVGLALSECEGAMLAAVEYMLAGLPMVTTPSRGGRELFFDERFVASVDPTPEAVATGVAEMKRRQVDPMLVRQATLARVNEHRQALCRYVQNILRNARAAVPTVDQIYDRIFGGETGTKARFVHSRDFASRGWL